MSANTGDRQLDPVEATPHLDSLYRCALRLTRDRARAEDLVQDTYIHALRYQQSFRPETDMKAWLFAIMRKLFWDPSGPERFEPQGLEGDCEPKFPPTIAAGDPGPGATTLDAIGRAEVIQAVDSLPAIRREVILLVDVEEFTYQETAEILGVPIATMMSRLRHARFQLRQSLAP